MKRRFPAQSPMRRAAASVVAVSALTLASACSMFNPVQTNVPYVQADGVPADIANLALRDLALVSNGSGSMVLTGAAINRGADALTVRVSPQGGEGATTSTGAEFKLKPNDQVNLATQGLQFSDTGAKAGRLVPLSITSSAGGTAIVHVPVLTATGPYATLTPTAVATSTSAATTTAPATSEATATPAPTTSTTSAG